MLDEDHAALSARAAELLQRLGWSVHVEVSFAVYSERGSVDLLATRRSDGAALVVEVKTRLMSVEELLRTLDRKVRLAPVIVKEREDWLPAITGRIVVMADDSTNRRRASRAALLTTALPMRGSSLRTWLGTPDRPAAGLAFLSLSRDVSGMRRAVARQRVRIGRPRSKPAPKGPRPVWAPGHESRDDYLMGEEPGAADTSRATTT